jgi:DNA-binding NarL/FixJ family response regulator
MKILLLDEHPLCREAITDILRNRVGQVETESVATVAEALEALGRAPAQLVVADFATGDVCGVPGLEGVVEAARGAVVATLDIRTIPSHARRAAAAGAKAYIPTTCTRELIDAALGVVLAGGSYFPDLSAVRATDRPPATSAKLSPRQAQVLDLLHGGLSNSEIAQALGISVATVKLHVHAILRATGARNRTDLLVRNVRAAREPLG